MDLLTVAIGGAAIAFGIVTFFMRLLHPGKFKKLEPMKKFWGETAGYAIHFAGYTIVPILAEIVILLKDLDGGTLF